MAASTLLPDRWTKPLVEVGSLPVHAQVSPAPGGHDLQAVLAWNTGDEGGSCVLGNRLATDLDLHVIEPDGSHVYFLNEVGSTSVLELDDLNGFGPENIYVPTGGAAAGTYQIFLVYYCGTIPTIATISVRVFADTPREQVVTFTRTLQTENLSLGYNVADVKFPAGTITERTDTRPVTVAMGAGVK